VLDSLDPLMEPNLVVIRENRHFSRMTGPESTVVVT
jgi:hypothetical protein